MTEALVERVLARNKRAIARLISQIENRQAEAQPVLSQLYPHSGRAHLVGITGAPGTGKSSLVSEIAKAYRQQGKTVAILAVDPSSPFSGGAVLGDRIRMQDLTRDSGVYIRSMASRGGSGGLAWAVDDALKVLDAAGFNVILIETVGAGQNEVDIVRTAHTVIVVEAPGLGDDVQAIKAGILEIADIFVVNKADSPNADRTVSVLQQMLELNRAPKGQILHHGRLMTAESPDRPDVVESSWRIPVLKTVALKGEGITTVIDTVDQHYQHLQTSDELIDRNRTRLTEELQTVLQAELLRRLLEELPPDYFSEIVAGLMDRKLTPYAASQKIIEKVNETRNLVGE